MNLLWPQPDSIPGLSDHQREICGSVLRSPVCILTGGPGTGKTYTFAGIVKAMTHEIGIGNIAVAAPTGKAAVRCTDALQRNGLSIEATTLHRLLRVNRGGHDGGGWGFLHNENNPLPHRIIIIDEASMLGTDLAASVLRACARGTHVLFVGDPYQLPPVDHGAPLRDLLQCIPSGELTKIERNSGDIIRVCRDIREGRRYQPSESICRASGRNVMHHEAFQPTRQIQYLSLLLESPPQGIDPIWDVQVLVAVNEKSEISRKKLNGLLQDMLNPAGERLKNSSCRFRIGDKVICTSNSMLPLDESEDFTAADNLDDDGELGDEQPKSFVANGEIGQVVDLQPKMMRVHFSCPRRTVKVPMGGSSDEANGGNAGCNFDLGYAITVHKAQGSQARIVIVMIDSSNGANQVCNREWHMTAMSRPEELLITIGKAATVNQQCRNVGLAKRKTFLKELLPKILQGKT